MPLNFGKNLFGEGLFKRSPNDDQVLVSAGSRQIPADQTVDTDTTYVNSDFDHDQLTNFNADKHKAWAASIAENIHGDNYTDTGDTTYTAGTGVDLTGTTFSSDDGNIAHDSLSGFDVNKHRAWAASIAQNIHANNYTDTQPTKEFWASAISNGITRIIGNFLSYATNLGFGETAGVIFKCPHDFTSITSAEIIIIPEDTNANADIDIASDYGAAGEAYNTHSGSDAATTYNLTQNQIYALDVSGILGSLAANDHVGITLDEKDTNTIHVIGFRLRYT